MRLQTKTSGFNKEKIISLLNTNYSELIKDFFEMQSAFLASRYKIHKNIETANIILALTKTMHLNIVRQRERNLDYNLSLNNFWHNFKTCEIPRHKIIAIVNSTGIPKETVRRKVKKWQ